MKQLILQMIEARENQGERLQQLKKMCTNEKTFNNILAN